MKAWLTKNRAIGMFKTRTGLSIASSHQAVETLPVKPDGCRKKVHIAHLEAAIRKATEPPTMAQGIRGLSEKQKEAIKARRSYGTV